MERISRELKNSILTAYFYVLMLFYPLYFDSRNGYQEMGNTKYYFFRNVSILVMLLLSALVLADLFANRQGKKIADNIHKQYKKLSVTDWTVYLYLLAVLLSYAFTAFKEEALWGTEGWYMGLVSQLVFVGIYFFYSRYFIWKDSMLYAALMASGIVFLLGILNRYSIYPITLYGQTPTFISTLGNINWFCGYMAVICPLGIAFYWKSQNIRQRIFAGIYVVLTFLCGVTQGSSSAYLAFAGIFLFLFGCSFRQNTDMKRFLELCFFFMMACQAARLMRYVPELKLNYEKDISILLTNTNLTLYTGIGIGIVYFLFCYLTDSKHNQKMKPLQISHFKWIRSAFFGIAAISFLGYLLLLVGNTKLEQGLFGLKENPFFTYNDSFANARGGIWAISAETYRIMPFLKRLVGAGPDCFASYIYAVPELAQRVYEQFGNARLTNAHNEWLTILITDGALGFCSYAGIFLSAIWRFVTKAEKQPMLYLCALCVLSYMLHNMVSFQQILNTPYVFLLLGIGEGFMRRTDKELDESE